MVQFLLGRKKVLANINKDKISLAEQPLPNAKGFLFGDDFPAIASKQAELSWPSQELIACP